MAVVRGYVDGEDGVSEKRPLAVMTAEIQNAPGMPGKARVSPQGLVATGCLVTGLLHDLEPTMNCLQESRSCTSANGLFSATL